jgi:hypothetical protein
MQVPAAPESLGQLSTALPPQRNLTPDLTFFEYENARENEIGSHNVVMVLIVSVVVNNTSELSDSQPRFHSSDHARTW